LINGKNTKKNEEMKVGRINIITLLPEHQQSSATNWTRERKRRATTWSLNISEKLMS
jgi:hypothetical protein